MSESETENDGQDSSTNDGLLDRIKRLVTRG
jgi:hypothetical protein